MPFPSPAHKDPLFCPCSQAWAKAAVSVLCGAPAPHAAPLLLVQNWHKIGFPRFWLTSPQASDAGRCWDTHALLLLLKLAVTPFCAMHDSCVTTAAATAVLWQAVCFRQPYSLLLAARWVAGLVKAVCFRQPYSLLRAWVAGLVKASCRSPVCAAGCELSAPAVAVKTQEARQW